MLKKYSLKFWIIFWFLAVFLLVGWYVFLQVKNKNIVRLKLLVSVLPIGAERRTEIRALMDIYASTASEKNLLVLFQNDLELRPGGGFVGAFGVVKIKNSKIADIQVFDTGNFDKNIPNTEAPPAPLADILGAENWKMRDSNWSSDFETNAKKAEYFYRLDGGSENIDGVIAINTSVLNSILAVTGPVKIEGYPGEYRDENAILQLEYQVEKGYAEQGIEKGERKDIMGELADVLAGRVRDLSWPEQFTLAKKMEAHLKQKDIQMFFEDKDLQSEMENLDWAGRVKGASGDFLMVVDANLNARKSDYCIKRKIDYSVDLSGGTPQAVLNISYEHTCRTKDWMTSDYRDWLRVYTPEGSNLAEANGQNGEVQTSQELGKNVFGMLVYVPVGETKTITLKYDLPDYVKNGGYSLLIQKQSGSGVVPMNIFLKKPDGSEAKVEENLTGDREIDF